MEVDVFHYHLHQCLKDGSDTADVHDEAFAWVMDNCAGQWECYQRLHFAFEKESDALMFRMMFG